ncbi:hypothetical protein DOTSEDRAFT_69558 [Dothistroma septosporum NZE10]|uniref:Uncharacterized protein n=1 Tax=Dothistroma septosporum (strain NZE10 / CBS 128990) TaxID=675120 RepID=N1PW90_DOTSN|nr:hypothetical protein DOTSEDRAFT_69558 [Dothistroma septosporum NZE10]
MDPFSPVAPAHVRVLVLPVGDIERQRFLRLLQRLQAETSIIPLTDVEQKTQDDGFFLSPTLSPRGSLLYRFSSAVPSEQHQQLSPFELFRDPLLVVGVVDGVQGTAEDGAEELDRAVAYLKERHPRVVHRQLIALKEAGEKASTDVTNTVDVFNVRDDNDPSLRSAVCELSARFLVEFSTYAKAVHATPTIQTPGQTARSLQRTTSLREGEKRLSSGRSTPDQSVDLSSPTDEGSPASAPSSRAPPLPATSFDQIPSANLASARPESRSSGPTTKVKSGARAPSQDRVSVQGFGSNTSQEKARLRGKARVGIVHGSIHMLAGQWSEALRIMLDHTIALRKLSDHLWYAKGLENMMVCMILLAWSGVDFSVPSICDPVADRSTSANTARIAAETRAAAEGTKQQLQLFRLSAAIPELTRLILSLYRSTEGALELPLIAVAEATVRVSKLLTGLNAVQGHATPGMLRLLIVGQSNSCENPASSTTTTKRTSSLASPKLSKAAIADILAQALPSEDDGISAGDSIRLLAAVASSYSSLGMTRKKAITIRELVGRLTSALNQARKLGAAEMGIHPAASLSVDTGADTLFAMAEESSGIKDLMTDVAAIYGAQLDAQRQVDDTFCQVVQLFGSRALQLDLLRQLAGFCEASPDPQGVLWLTSSLLRTAGPNAAVDGVPFKLAVNAFSREEQMHYATVIHRTVALSKHFGLADARAVYWDPFLVRGVEIQHLKGPLAVIDRSKLSSADLTGQVRPGNPLLYDPNASRPGTAVEPVSLLVQDEACDCLVTLQNPFDIPVDIEELALVTEGVELSCQHEPATLGPLRFQQVQLTITPNTTGYLKVTGCRIKMQGCQSQVFPVVDKAWSSRAPQTVKALGLEAVPAQRPPESRHDVGSIGVVTGTVSATVIGALPTLLHDRASALDTSIMLLEGENRSLDIVLSNNSDMAACVFEISDTAKIVSQEEPSSADGTPETPTIDAATESKSQQTVLEPGDTTVFKLQLNGKAGVSVTQVNFFYCANGSGHPRSSRVVSVPISMTVNAALQLHNLEVTPAQGEIQDALLVSFDVRNAWPRSIYYTCTFDNGTAPKTQIVNEDDVKTPITPGEVRRVHLIVPQLNRDDAADADDSKIVQARFLNRLHLRWEVDERKGVADVHGLSLSPDSMALVRIRPVRLSAAAQHMQYRVGGFVGIQVKLTNQSKSKTGPLLVRLLPRGPDVGHNERRMAVAGTLQRIVPPLNHDAESVVDFIMCPLLAGTLELDAMVQPARIGPYASANQWYSSRALSLEIEAR